MRNNSVVKIGSLKLALEYCKHALIQFIIINEQLYALNDHLWPTNPSFSSIYFSISNLII